MADLTREQLVDIARAGYKVKRGHSNYWAGNGASYKLPLGVVGQEIDSAGEIQQTVIGDGTLSYSDLTTPANLIIQRMTSPDQKYQDGIAAAVDYWIAAGQWDLITSLWVFQAGSEANSLINWKNSSFDATKVLSPTFTADAGWVSDGSGYLDSNFSPADGVGHLTNMSFHYMTGVEDETPTGTQVIYGVADASNVGHLFLPENSGAGNQGVVRNFVTAGTAFTAQSSGLIPGFSTHERTATNDVRAWLNGVQQGATVTTQSPSAFTGTAHYSILAHNNNGTREFFLVEPNFKLGMLGFCDISADRDELEAGYDLYLAAIA